MKTKIVVISDTHCRTWEEIDSHIREVIKDALLQNYDRILVLKL